MPKTIYWHLREAPFLRKMRAIQLLAPSHARFLRERGINTPTFAIPNGLERHQLEVAIANAGARVDPEPEPRNTLRLLYFGRWDMYNKGLDLLLEAIGSDPSIKSSVHLQIAGRGSDRDERAINRLIQTFGLEDGVSTLGFIPDIASAVRSVDFVVLPSRFDGFAQAIIETLALATPVIVSSRAGSSEYFGRGDGALVTEPNVPSLIEALHIALGSRDELREAARTARPRLLRDFNWDAVAQRWIDEAQRLGVPGTGPTGSAGGQRDG